MKPIAIVPSHGRIGRSDREGVHAVRRVSDVHERTERATRVDLRALAPEDACTLRACLLNEVTEHRGLADAGLARHQCCPAMPAEALAQEAPEPPHFGVASDEDGTKDPPVRLRTRVCSHAALPALDSVTQSSPRRRRAPGLART